MTLATDTWKLIEPYAQRRMDEMIADGSRVGAGNEYPILLYDGNEIIEYSNTDAGLTAALAAAASGDLVWVLTGGITGGPWTVGSGITLRGQSRDSTVLTGDMTLNGILENIKIVGDVTASAGLVEFCHLAGNTIVNTNGSIRNGILSATSGTIVTLTYGQMRRCSVALQGAGMLGIDAQDGGGAQHVIMTDIKVFLGTGGGGDGILINGSKTYATFIDVLVDGLAVDIRDARFVSDCVFWSIGDNGGEHPSGTAVVANTYFHTEDGGSDGLNLAAGNITLHDCGWSSITGIANVTYGEGDRGAYAVESFHAEDIEDSQETRHTAAPVAQGDMLAVDSNPYNTILSIGSAHMMMKVNAGGTDPAWEPFDWDEMAGVAGADMAHDHGSAGEGGEVTLASLSDYTQGDLIIGGAADWEDLAVGTALAVLTNDGTDVAWSTGLLDIAAGKTLDVDNSLTLAGVDGKTLTLTTDLTNQGAAGTLAWTDAATLTIPAGGGTAVVVGGGDWDTLWTDAVHSHANAGEGGNIAAVVSTIADAGSLYTASEVEAALQEVMDRVTPVTYTGNSITIPTGVLDAGDINSTTTIDDADSYDVSEVGGAPGFDVQITFTGIASGHEPNLIQLHISYDGAAGHNINFELWNYTGAPQWDVIDTMTDSTGNFIFLEIDISGTITDYVSGGEAKLRFNHTSAGNPNDDFRIDFAALKDDPGGMGGISDHGALSGLQDDDHLIYTLVDGTRAFTGNQSFGDNDITNVGIIDLDAITSDGAAITIGGTPNIVITDGTSIAITLGNDAGDDFIIDTSVFVVEGDRGFVGINTASPTAQLTIADSASNAPLSLTERAAEPDTPVSGDIYLDDGTNTSSGAPGWRRYTGAAWEDIYAAAGTGYWSRDAGNGYIYPSNIGDRVGIGTNAPGSSLHIARDADPADFVLERTGAYSGTDSVSFISFHYATDSVADILVVRDGADDAAALLLRTQPASGAVTERIRITSTGRMGVGTDDPDAPIHISDSGSIPLRLERDAGGSANEWAFVISNNPAGGGADLAVGSLTIKSIDNIADFSILTTGLTGSPNFVVKATTGNVGIGTPTPAPSALLDLSSTTGALLLPRMTTGQRNALTGVIGMIIWNTGLGKVQACISVGPTVWQSLH